MNNTGQNFSQTTINAVLIIWHAIGRKVMAQAVSLNVSQKRPKQTGWFFNTPTPNEKMAEKISKELDKYTLDRRFISHQDKQDMRRIANEGYKKAILGTHHE